MYGGREDGFVKLSYIFIKWQYWVQPKGLFQEHEFHNFGRRLHGRYNHAFSFSHVYIRVVKKLF